MKIEREFANTVGGADPRTGIRASGYSTGVYRSRFACTAGLQNQEEVRGALSRVERKGGKAGRSIIPRAQTECILFSFVFFLFG